MAMLLFYAGENRFLIDCSSILRVVPYVSLKKMPHEVPHMAGILILAGKAVPIVDFCQMIEHRQTSLCLDSRIILLNDPRPESKKIAGILGEKVDEIVNFPPDAFSKNEFYLHHFPFLDKGTSDPNGIIQSVNIEGFFQFLSEELFHEVDHGA